MPDDRLIDRDTRAAFADIDASPTKTWLIRHRFDDGLDLVLRHGWEKRPGEELCDLRKDPHQIKTSPGSRTTPRTWKNSVFNSWPNSKPAWIPGSPVPLTVRRISTEPAIDRTR